MVTDLSLSARRNLRKSKIEENKYSRDMRVYVVEYGAALKEALARATHTDAEGNTFVDLAAFQQERERPDSQMLNGRGKEISKLHAKTAMVLGIHQSDTGAKKAGVNDGRV